MKQDSTQQKTLKNIAMGSGVATAAFVVVTAVDGWIDAEELRAKADTAYIQTNRDLILIRDARDEELHELTVKERELRIQKLEGN